MNLTQEQIRVSAVSGMKLLGSEEILPVSGVQIVSGELQLLYFLLRAISTGELVVSPPPVPINERNKDADTATTTE